MNLMNLPNQRWILICVIFTLAVQSVIAQEARQLTQVKPKVSDKRIALVIGNGSYQRVSPLDNPVNDATDIAAALRTLRFDVIIGTDTNLVQMKRLIREFGEKLAQQKGVGLFYYAGHGVEVRGKNFLVPIDADIAREVETEFYAIDVNLILTQMDDANNGFNIVILDACRNNPFSRGWSRSGDTGGLANVNAPTGSFIAFAAAPGKTASDGKGTRNGVFTGALLKILKRPNLKLEEVFKTTREEVMRLTDSKQVPWDSSSVKGDFYFVRESGLESSKVVLSAVAISTPNLATPCGAPEQPACGEAALNQVSIIGSVASRLIGAEPVILTKPEFPSFARGMSGTIRIQLSVDTKGKVTDARPVSGPSVFYQASIAAAMSSKYKPTIYEGKAVGLVRELIYSFDGGGQSPCEDSGLRIISKPQTAYTEKGRSRNVRGTVILRVNFMDDGEIGVVDVVKALDAGLTSSAIVAAKKITFIPACKDGTRISVLKQIDYTYDIY